MTAGIRLFETVIEPGVGVVEGWRGPESHRLSVACKPEWFMTPQTAARLGRSAKSISTHLHRALPHSEAVKPCAVFRGWSHGARRPETARVLLLATGLISH
jgi:hypothetical protein